MPQSHGRSTDPESFGSEPISLPSPPLWAQAAPTPRQASVSAPVRWGSRGDGTHSRASVPVPALPPASLHVTSGGKITRCFRVTKNSQIPVTLWPRNDCRGQGQHGSGPPAETRRDHELRPRSHSEWGARGHQSRPKAGRKTRRPSTGHKQGIGEQTPCPRPGDECPENQILLRPAQAAFAISSSPT